MALPLGLPVTRLDAPPPKPAATATAFSPGSITGSSETSVTLTHGRWEARTILEESPSTSTIPTDIINTERLFKAISTRCRIKNTHDGDFNAVLDEALEAIDSGVNPELIPSGSSGSYFVYDKNQRPIGVFKPKDEEPFAPLNPKWPKFFQRMLCFCCFGRACLIPNNGYLSETAASLVDERLKLYVVPKTRVVKLASPAFNYGRGLCRSEQRPKEGSFQLFVHGFRPAGEVLAEWAAKGPSALTPSEEAHFLLLFQKMCVLDYVIRNTDRHTDNWLIRHVPDEPIQVAVIDNGLAFPVKHPECASRFRHYPFHWADLPWAQKPLERNFRESLMGLLTPKFVHDLSSERSSVVIRRTIAFSSTTRCVCFGVNCAICVMPSKLMNPRPSGSNVNLFWQRGSSDKSQCRPILRNVFGVDRLIIRVGIVVN
uniref:Phosphatidylinositol 4-kinase type 2 n=1 Tax=Panagrellus redivivus TaxID=6233 RepID=A0A7E4W4H2_PANRE